MGDIPKISLDSAANIAFSEIAYAGEQGKGQGKYSIDRTKNKQAELASRFNSRLGGEIMSYKIVNSDQNMLMAVNEKDKKVIVAFRGTNFENWTDLMHDGSVLFGDRGIALTSVASAALGTPHRFNTAKNYVRNAQKSFPGYDVTATGHSLGGTIATHVAMTDPSVKCETFNPGISPFDLERNGYIRVVDTGLSLFGLGLFKNIKDNHIVGDPISATYGVGRNTNYDCGKLGPFKAHSHDNFLGMLDKQYSP